MTKDNKDNTSQNVKEIISGIIGKPVGTMVEGEKWDSLTHLKIVMELENHFHITFKTEEVFTMDSVATICNLVRTHLHGKT